MNARLKGKQKIEEEATNAPSASVDSRMDLKEAVEALLSCCGQYDDKHLEEALQELIPARIRKIFTKEHEKKIRKCQQQLRRLSSQSKSMTDEDTEEEKEADALPATTVATSLVAQPYSLRQQYGRSNLRK